MDPAPPQTRPLAQVRRLLGTMSPRESIAVYLDEWIGSLLRPIPSFIGAVLRWAYFRLAFERLDGFCFVRPGARINYPSGMSVGAQPAPERRHLHRRPRRDHGGRRRLDRRQRRDPARRQSRHRTVVAAAVVVNGDTEPYSIVAGIPAKLVGAARVRRSTGARERRRPASAARAHASGRAGAVGHRRSGLLGSLQRTRAGRELGQRDLRRAGLE